MGVLIDLDRTIDDEWRPLDRAGTVPCEHPVIVSLEQLQAEADQLVTAYSRLAVNLPASETVEVIAPFLGHLELVVLNFEVFADGRAFSQARLLRDRYRYRGRLRARGDVVRDLLSFMQRCGIDQFELAAGEDVALALSAFGEISRNYQPEQSRRAG